MSVDPFVIRSQRNRDRRPAPPAIPGVGINSSNEYFERDPNGFGHGSQSKLRMVRRKDHLGYISTSALIFNRMVGTGIFVAPPVVLAIVGSKGLALLLWLVGGVVTCAGLLVYLEYGYVFPLTGGELHYIDHVWLRPKMLMTYMFAVMFILLSGSQSNALVFGAGIIQASTSEGTAVDPRLEKFIAIAMVAVVCQLQAFSRLNYILFSNFFAIYKVTLLTILTILGWCALGSVRVHGANSSSTPFGSVNLRDAFAGIDSQPYAIALALLDILRVYSGYENANFVLEEVRRPPGDETRVFRRSAISTVSLISFFYIMVNISLFAACTSEELTSSSDVLAIFFTKIFGQSPHTRTASGVILALSSAGNVMATTFAAVRVKQEIARLGILPWPAFWAKSTRMNTPGPALLLHWIFSTILIAATPLQSPNGYLVFSTLYNYARTPVAIILGGALLFATRLDSFNDIITGARWGADKKLYSKIVIYLLSIIFIVANAFVFIVSWFPASLQNTLHTKARVVPTFAGPVMAVSCFAAGAILWLWDLHIAPALGWTMEPLQEQKDGLNVHMSFKRTITGVSERVIRMFHLERLFVPDEKHHHTDDEDAL